MTSILLVEDNDLNRDMLTRRLQRMGYEVSVALDGKEGVEQAREINPDLILMDLGLPVMDGLEATRQIKSNPDTVSTPVIALTAHTFSTDRENAFAAGCDDFEAKPVNFHQLLMKIEKFVAL